MASLRHSRWFVVACRLAQVVAGMALAVLIAWLGLTINQRSSGQDSRSAQVLIQSVATLMVPRTALAPAGAEQSPEELAQIQRIVSRQDWQSATHAISQGWTDQVLWTRLEIENTSDTPHDVWLEVAPARLTWVRLHRLAEDASWQARTSGVAISGRDRPINTPDIVFPLRLKPKEKQTLLLQAQSNTTALNMVLQLHDPARFASLAANSHFWDVLVIGGTITLGLIALAAGVALREPLQLLLGMRSILIGVWLLFQLGVLSMSLSAPAAAFWAEQVSFAAVFSLFLSTSFMWLFLTRTAEKGLPYAIHLIYVSILTVNFCGMVTAFFGWAHATNLTTLFGVLTWAALLFSVALSIWRIMLGQAAAMTILIVALCALLINTQAILSLLGYASDGKVRFFISPIPVLISTALFFVGAVMQLDRERRARARLVQEVQQRALAQLEEQVSRRTQALLLARDEAQAANRAKTLFMAKISHELRNPMHSLLGYIHLALGDKLSDSVSRKLQFARRAGEQLVTQITDLMDYSRLNQQQIRITPVPFSMFALCESVNERAQLLSPEQGNPFNVHIEPSLAEHWVGDDVRIEQVLMLLITNAMRYTVDGQVRLAVQSVRQNPSLVQPAHSVVRFSVSDTGRGISAQALTEIFEVFERGPSTDSEGMGLGLPIAKQLLGLMGSRLQVQSEIGQGSEFSFDLVLMHPAQALPVTVSVGAPVAPAEPPVGQRRALILDDDALSLAYLRELLEHEGFEVVSAMNLAQVRAALDASSAKPFALYCIDQYLGGQETGWDALRDISALGNHAPVIMISAAPMQAPADADQALKAGAMPPGLSAFLNKPINPALILSTITRCLAHLEPQAHKAPIKDWVQLQSIAQTACVSQLIAWQAQYLPRTPENSQLDRWIERLEFSRIEQFAQEQLALLR